MKGKTVVHGKYLDRIILVLSLMVLGTMPAVAGVKKGAFKGTSIRFSVSEKGGSQIRYCSHGSCTDIVLVDGAKIHRSSGWTVGINRDGDCYKVRYQVKAVGVDLRGRAC